MSGTLLPLPEATVCAEVESVCEGPARLLCADRRQVLLRPCDLESLRSRSGASRAGTRFETESGWVPSH